MKKPIAEFIGTFALIFFGCGAILFMLPEVGLLGVSLAFGLTVTAMAYGIGPISGAHINPAVSLGVLLAGEMSVSDFVGYVVAQFLGGIVAALALLAIASGMPDFDSSAGFATNSPGLAGVAGALVFEAIATFLFVTVILGATQKGVDNSIAGIAIGLTLVVIHLAGISISGSSVNPARSLGPALIEGGAALGDVWIYFVGPLVGGAAAGLVHKMGITRK